MASSKDLMHSFYEADEQDENVNPDVIDLDDSTDVDDDDDDDSDDELINGVVAPQSELRQLQHNNNNNNSSSSSSYQKDKDAVSQSMLIESVKEIVMPNATEAASDQTTTSKGSRSKSKKQTVLASASKSKPKPKANNRNRNNNKNKKEVTLCQPPILRHRAVQIGTLVKIKGPDDDGQLNNLEYQIDHLGGVIRLNSMDDFPHAAVEVAKPSNICWVSRDFYAHRAERCVQEYDRLTPDQRKQISQKVVAVLAVQVPSQEEDADDEYVFHRLTVQDAYKIEMRLKQETRAHRLQEAKVNHNCRKQVYESGRKPILVPVLMHEYYEAVCGGMDIEGPVVAAANSSKKRSRSEQDNDEASNPRLVKARALKVFWPTPHDKGQKASPTEMVLQRLLDGLVKDPDSRRFAALFEECRDLEELAKNTWLRPDGVEANNLYQHVHDSFAELIDPVKLTKQQMVDNVLMRLLTLCTVLTPALRECMYTHRGKLTAAAEKHVAE